MPIYEYECKSCGHQMEEMQKMADPPLVTCPACSEESLTKLISAAGFRLKGSGWYETDFKSSSSKKNLHSDSSGAEKSSAKCSNSCACSNS